VSTEQTLIELDRWMGDAVARVHRAVRNLQEVSPGFSSSTPGNGSPGGGSGGGGSSSSIVARLAFGSSDDLSRSISDDAAVHALERLRALVREMTPLVRETRDICQRWGYSAAGEYETGPRRQPSMPSTETEQARAKWCRSCARLQHMVPVGEKGRRSLCRWCADFEDAEKVLPPLSLLDLRHRGGRISTALVQRELRADRGAVAVKPKSRKKKRR
jgi:hypothetical protein